jgi:hypothetical protein
MIAAVDIGSMTLDPGFEPPAIMAESNSTSAFNIDSSNVITLSPYFGPRIGDRENEVVTLTDLFVHFADPSHALAHELGEKFKRAQTDLQAYKVRIAALRADAEQDGYGLNAASERDFWYFVHSEPFILKGTLVLMDNGNLRAMWKGEDGTHIGLQFLGGRTVQYVIFARRATAGAASRVAGRDSIDGVKLQLETFNLRPLIFA